MTKLRDTAEKMVPGLMALVLPVSVLVGRASIAVSLALAVLAAIAAGYRPSRHALPADARTAAALLAVVLVGWLPSMAGSQQLSHSLGSWLGTGVVFALPIAFVTAFRATPAVCRAALRLFMIGMVLVLAVAVLSMTVAPWLIALRGTGLPPDRILKSAASAVACGVPVLLLAGWRLGGGYRALAWAGVALGVVTIVLTHSRSGLVGLAAAALCVGFLLALHHFGRLRTLGATVLLLALVAVLMAKAMPWTLPDTDFGGFHLKVPTWMVDAHRQVIWQFVADRFAERPWLGWGINTINMTPGAGAKIPGLDHEYIPAHPHNWVMEVLSETGVVGFVPAILAVVGAGVVTARRWLADGSPFVLAGLALWVVFWVASLSNFSFWSLWWQASMAAMAMMIVICRQADAPTTVTP